MLYEVRHCTTYEYDHDVLLSHHLARLTPRDLPRQRCHQHVIETSPKATTRSTNIDHFGNTATFLTIEGAHQRLDIISRGLVERGSSAAIALDDTPPWEDVR